MISCDTRPAKAMPLRACSIISRLRSSLGSMNQFSPTLRFLFIG